MTEPKQMSTATVKQMLQQQRDDFSAMITSLMNSFNDRYDRLKETVTEIRVSLEYSQQDIAAIKDSLELQDKNQQSVCVQMTSIQDNLKEIESSVDYLENQSRRNNVIFDGIQEDVNETWQDSERKVNEILEESMNLDGLVIERAHRVGKPRSPRGRLVVVKFLNYKDREEVLRNAKNLKGTDVYVREDVSSRVLSKRREQLPQLKAARQSGKLAYFKFDKLIIKDSTTPKDLPNLNDEPKRVLTRSKSTTQPK